MFTLTERSIKQVTLFLLGFQTTVCGCAAATKVTTKKKQRLPRSSRRQLSRMFKRWLSVALLAPATYGAHSRRRVFTLEVTF